MLDMTLRRTIKAGQTELEIKGPGVERVVIKEVESAALEYMGLRDERMETLEEEVEAKKRLLEVMHANAERIGKDRDGSMTYRFGDQMIILKPGKEEIKVKSVPGETKDEESEG
jgi:hypothetical protein